MTVSTFNTGILYLLGGRLPLAARSSLKCTDLRTDTLTIRGSLADEACRSNAILGTLPEILEMGHHGRFYTGLSNFLASEVALAYGAPTKTLMTSWFFSLNYIHNVPATDHLRYETSTNAAFGLHNALAILAKQELWHA